MLLNFSADATTAAASIRIISLKYTALLFDCACLVKPTICGIALAMMLAALMYAPAPATARHLQQSKILPSYGNYCGSQGNSTSATQPDPIDGIAKCCQQHKECKADVAAGTSVIATSGCQCHKQIAACVDKADLGVLSAVQNPVQRAKAAAAQVAIWEWYQALVTVNLRC